MIVKVDLSSSIKNSMSVESTKKLFKAGSLTSLLLICSKAIMLYWMAEVSNRISENDYGELGYLRGITLQISVILCLGLTMFIPANSKKNTIQEILGYFHYGVMMIFLVSFLIFPLFFLLRYSFFSENQHLWLNVYLVGVSLALYGIVVATSFATGAYKKILSIDLLLVLIYVLIDLFIVNTGNKIVSFTFFNVLRTCFIYITIRINHSYKSKNRVGEFLTLIKRSLPYLNQEIIVVVLGVIFLNQLLDGLSPIDFASYIVIGQIIALIVFLPNSLRGWILANLSIDKRNLTFRNIFLVLFLFPLGYLIYLKTIPLMLFFFNDSYEIVVYQNQFLIYSTSYLMALGAVSSQILIIQGNINYLTLLKAFREFMLVIGLITMSKINLYNVLVVMLFSHATYQTLIISKIIINERG